MRAMRFLGWRRGWVGAIALVTLAAPTAAFVTAAPAGAANDFTLDITPQSNTSLTFLATNADGTCSNFENLNVTAVTAGPSDTPVTPTSTEQQDTNDVVFVLPAGTPSPITVTGGCFNSADDPISATAEDLAFATVSVAKVVQGSDPATATFTVAVACTLVGSGSTASGFGSGASSVHSASPEPPSAGNLQYGAAGGTLPFYVYDESTCTVTEPNTGGATSTTINPNPVDVADPIPYSVTVTNTFAAAAIVALPAFTG
jgi:hypothetical protein